MFDLEALGLGKINSVDIFEEDKEECVQEKREEHAVAEHNEEDFLFDKTITCPVCQKAFKTKQIKIGKPRFVGTDSDLRPRYENIDTVKYDAVVCLHCGYAGLMRNFNSISARQIKEVREKIGKTFKGMTVDNGPYSYQIAVQRYNLALYSGVVMHAKVSERAYICLKLAWLYRGMIENLSKDTPDFEKTARDYAIQELIFTKKAYEGFLMAIAKEMPPICNMDENTINYMVSDLGRKCQDYDSAEKLAYAVIASRTATAKLKEKARIEIDMIKKDRERHNK